MNSSIQIYFILPSQREHVMDGYVACCIDLEKGNFFRLILCCDVRHYFFAIVCV
jgi:hypothetical protein